MRKYTFVFKKKVVSDYLNNEGGYKYLAHKYQINRTLVRHWVRIYNYHGWEGLVGGGKSYTTKFKLDVIEYMETNGLSIQETAKKFNIGSNRTLSKWIEQYEEGGASSLESQKRGRKISMNSKLNIPKKLKDESLEEEVIRLRAENAYFKKVRNLDSRTRFEQEEIKVKTILQLKKEFKLNLLLSIAQLAKSTYYYRVKKLDKPDKCSKIKQEITAIVKESRNSYGYRRVTLALKMKGYTINHKTVRKLMSQMGLTCQIRIKRYKSYKGTVGKIAKNVLKRNFSVDTPNKKWVTDVTEFKIKGRKIYLSPILDLFNGEIISYSISTSPTYKLIEEMLQQAIKKKGTEGSLILHSDQGWQYQMPQYQKKLKENNIIQSMSRKGNCLDNSVIENFFGVLKSEFFYREKFRSIEIFQSKLNEYIRWYNNKRIKLKLNGLSPVEYRKQSIK
ncbi:IS3-like element ISEnfa3 family transposase [Enterococcus faecium]|uniref:IS3-like element ISEnfa3 family transposase n=1 Tax=Enterococcus faecium TaxID=1352 RepID=UPI001890E9BE|nr:IS3-like element ISEnfa3 family transposase [Enterococcus faecium]